MKKTLFIYAHPSPKSSRANSSIARAVSSLPNLLFHPIYEVYPEFDIDVEAEQTLLNKHDLIVFQHPLYWYSMPPLLKLWVDLVLEYGFAYGPEGNALRGKDFLLSVTAGGPAASYAPEGYNRYPIESFFPPYRQTAQLCGMVWHDPLVLFHAARSPEDILVGHGEAVRDRILGLCGVSLPREGV